VSHPIRLDLVSTGRASDAGYLAAADVAEMAARIGASYRLVGGNAVTLLVFAHGVSDLVPARETADADFAAAHQVVADPRLIDALSTFGYTRVAGNRFTRTHTLAAIDTAPTTEFVRWNLAVDVLAPSYEGRLVPNRAHGDLVVDEVPGLAVALERPGTTVALHVRLTTGNELVTDLVLPDITSAICMKSYAYAGRRADRDAVDLWRLLEAGAAAGVTAKSWPTSATGRDAAAVLRKYFGRPGGVGAAQASVVSADRTRIRGLVALLVGTE
jgi:hypothetical protein